MALGQSASPEMARCFKPCGLLPIGGSDAWRLDAMKMGLMMRDTICWSNPRIQRLRIRIMLQAFNGEKPIVQLDKASGGSLPLGQQVEERPPE